MPEKTINEVIADLVRNESTDVPYPSKITIVNKHDNGYIDIQDKDGNVQKNIECIGNTYDVGDTGILFTLEDNELVVITK